MILFVYPAPVLWQIHTVRFCGKAMESPWLQIFSLYWRAVLLHSYWPIIILAYECRLIVIDISWCLEWIGEHVRRMRACCAHPCMIARRNPIFVGGCHKFCGCPIGHGHIYEICCDVVLVFCFWSRGVLWVFGCIDEIFEKHFFYPLQSSLDNFKWLKTLVEFLWYHNFSVSIYFDFDGFLVVLHVLLDIKKNFVLWGKHLVLRKQKCIHHHPSINR